MKQTCSTSHVGSSTWNLFRTSSAVQASPFLWHRWGLPVQSTTFSSALPTGTENLVYLKKTLRVCTIVPICLSWRWNLPLPFRLGGWWRGDDPREPPRTSRSGTASFNTGQLELSLALCASKGFRAHAAKSFEFVTYGLPAIGVQINWRARKKWDHGRDWTNQVKIVILIGWKVKTDQFEVSQNTNNSSCENPRKLVLFELPCRPI